MNSSEKPLKNLFAFKLLLSILEMLCLNPISLAAGITACVLTANANASYKSRRWQDFRRQAKASTAALWAGFCGFCLQLFLLILLVPSLRSGWSSYQYNQFLLEGNEITLPMSFRKFEQLNFSIAEDMSGYKINPGETLQVEFTSGAYAEEPGYALPFGILTVANDSSQEAISLTEGTAIGITLTNIPRLSPGGIVLPEIELKGGVTFDTPPQELLALYSEPDLESHGKNYETSQYVWFMPGYEENFYNQILFDYAADRMVSVTIQNRTFPDIL